jgi:hypothetical protein
MVVSVLAVVPLLNCLLYYYWFFDWTFSSVQVVVPLLDCVLGTGSGVQYRTQYQYQRTTIDETVQYITPLPVHNKQSGIESNASTEEIVQSKKQY